MNDPDFFRKPAPPGRSRESTIVLDADGKFFHDDEAFVHKRLEEAMHAWITRHPDDGRYILCNGEDWTYFRVVDVPYIVRALELGNPPICVLSDASREPLRADETFLGRSGALYTRIKHDAPFGPYWAKFSRHAQTSLAPYLEMEGEKPAIRVGNVRVVVGERATFG